MNWKIEKVKGVYRLIVDEIVRTNSKWKVVSGNPQVGYVVINDPYGMGRIYCDGNRIIEESTTGDVAILYTSKV